ncbi:hypothetical protein DPMN_084897 [Dreissena polymorpha]|uniref:Uncharacterized protein n=1 Tax=Dreissena polymorpha TaxID=45954 RepID=A0A9D3YE05_DREPO|nr:hypothetical protein DPMN_084897 [Dreissena polymorpha]
MLRADSRTQNAGYMHLNINVSEDCSASPIWSTIPTSFRNMTATLIGPTDRQTTKAGLV